jgi:hypothetical protein
MDLVNAARAILAGVGIGKSDKPAAAYLEPLKRYDPETYAAVQELVDAAGAVSTAGSGDYRKLSVDDFADLRETVQSLWTLARRTRQIEIDGQKLDRAAITEALGASVEAITKPGPRAGYERAVTTWDKTQMKLLGVRASLRRVEHWVRAMDSGADAGVFRKYVWNPVSEGITAYRLAKREAIAKYAEIVKPSRAPSRATRSKAPELGYTFRDKAELLGAMLHIGNESNLSKLLRGRGWGAVDEQGVLDRSRWDAFVDRLHKDGTLTKPDYDYLQGVWDLFDELKAGAQRAHKELYGHYFSEVTADPVETPFGTYKGGYAPAKADPFIAPDAQIRADREALEHSDNSFMFPTAGRGFTKARVEQYAKPLILDVGLVPSHIDAVLRFTHIEPRVRDVGRVIMDRGFREQLDAFDPTVGGDMLVPWLQRAALQRIELSSKGLGRPRRGHVLPRAPEPHRPPGHGGERDHDARAAHPLPVDVREGEGVVRRRRALALCPAAEGARARDRGEVGLHEDARVRGAHGSAARDRQHHAEAHGHGSRRRLREGARLLRSCAACSP